jgi:hypothetical protein
MTLFVDIIAVPAVFKNVTKVEEAGKVGMRVFTMFNRLEFALATIILIGSIALFKMHQKKLILIVSTVLFCWSISYNLFFTPQIVYYTKMLHTSLVTDPMMATYQINHSFYHQLYRYLDTTKMIMIIYMMVSFFRTISREEK